MNKRDIFVLSTVSLLVSVSTPAFAADAIPNTTSTQTSSNGSSTGVGNAGSFGIGSGTSDSIATATATSDGMVDNSVDNSVASGTNISVLADQELNGYNTYTNITLGTSVNGAGIATGSNSLNGSSFSNYAGILNNGWNTAPAGNAQAATNISVNGAIGGN